MFVGTGFSAAQKMISTGPLWFLHSSLMQQCAPTDHQWACFVMRNSFGVAFSEFMSVMNRTTSREHDTRAPFNRVPTDQHTRKPCLTRSSYLHAEPLALCLVMALCIHEPTQLPPQYTSHYYTT